MFRYQRYSAALHGAAVVLFFSLLFGIFFSPVLTTGRLLAPGDGLTYYVPAFVNPFTLWTDLLFGGFPVAADPQNQFWYPPRILLSLWMGWNPFVVSAYVLASCFAFGYTHTLTRSRLAGLVSGSIYGMSGFMLAHLGHPPIIHAAAWLPLLLWALEKLRHEITIKWFLLGGLAVASSLLSGHPQLSAYTLGLGGLYVAFMAWTGTVSRWKYLRIYPLMILFGLSLGAIQLLPTLELAAFSLRTEMSFSEFVSYSLPSHQVAMLVFPYLFGGVAESFYGQYFGRWNQTELSGYVGLLSLLLAGVGFAACRKKPVAWFWLLVALLAFLLALGDSTPLAQFMYHVPAYNKFRVPARHLVEFAFAASVLAGLGVTAILERRATRRHLWGSVLIGGGMMFTILACVVAYPQTLQELATKGGIERAEFSQWSSPAIGVPVVIFFLAAGILFYWSLQPASGTRQLLLITILIVDLGSFGWFCEWKYLSPEKDLLAAPEWAQSYRKLLSADYQRILPVRGGLGEATEIPPNLSALWKVPSASGYNPLILSRVSELLWMYPSGLIEGNWFAPSNRTLDIMGVRFVFLPRTALYDPPAFSKDGVSWAVDDMPIALGSGCGGPQPNAVNFPLPAPTDVTGIAIVSAMACSTAITDGQEVARISVIDIEGHKHVGLVRAGEHTAEWAYDCPDVRPLVRHRRPSLFESFPVTRASHPPCEGHKFEAILSLRERYKIKQVEIEWTGLPAAINVQKVSLVDAETQRSRPLAPLASSLSLADSTRWRRVEDIGVTSVYENLRVRPRVWLVSEVATVPPEEVLRAIKESRLGDGRPFDPARMALVEEPLQFKIDNPDPQAIARVTHSAGTSVEIQTKSISPAFLVLSDVNYPGWEATLDGSPTHVFQTDYVLRGVLLPAGEHTVLFRFRPRSLHLGALMTCGAMFLFLALLTQFMRTPSALKKPVRLASS